MARKRKRNPTDNHSGLGAFLGSLAAASPGAAFRSVPLISLGSIVGGGIGGYVGAKKDRKERGAIGGAVGGAILGPIGAAVGGYIAGKKPDAKRQNPGAVTYALAIGAGIAAVGGGYLIKRQVDARRLAALPPKALPPAEALKTILGTGTLGEVPFMVNDIAAPILLRVTPADLPIDDEFDYVPDLRIRVPKTDGSYEIIAPAGASFGITGELGSIPTSSSSWSGTSDPNTVAAVSETGQVTLIDIGEKAISSLVTGLSAEANRLAYELVLLNLGNTDLDWYDVDQMDDTIEKVLTTIAPKVDWRERLKPHAYGGPAWQAWAGVQIVGTVANQSLLRKRASR